MSLRKEIDDENLITEEAVKAYPKVTRVEVIDSTGRAYQTWEAADVTTILQDDERTLKVFLRNTDA